MSDGLLATSPETVTVTDYDLDSRDKPYLCHPSGTRWAMKVFLVRTLLTERTGSAETKVRLRGKLLLLAASVVLSLLFVESFLCIFPYVALSTSQRRELAWRATHKTAERVLTRKWYSFDRYSPELGWELKPNLRTPGINSNSKGLRGTREYALEPPAGVRRVLCVGDSFMFGEKLTDEQTLPAQLEAILNREGRWEVLNLADHGYGTDQQWLRLEHLGFQYHADFVVLGFFEEDLGRNTHSFRDYAKPYFELAGERLILRNTPVPAPEELLSHPPEWPSCALRSWCALQLIAEQLARVSPWPGLEHTKAGKVTLAILDAMLQASRSRGLQFVVMIIPPRQLRPNPSKVEELLSKWAERTRTPLIDFREAYLRLPQEEQARLYAGHWTSYGAAVAAQVLAEKIRDLLLTAPVKSPL